MRRSWVCLTAFATAAVLPSAAAQQPAGWSTVKGQIVFPAGDPIPERKALEVIQDKAQCLRKGAILDETLIVNAKSRGIKSVLVWLRPDEKDVKAKLQPNQIHPDDQKRKAATVELDQPCCMFIPRVQPARVGDTIVVKNSDVVAHNFFWTSANNGNFNPNIPAGGQFQFPIPLAAEPGPIPYKCSIHPWMAGTVRVFDHPYYAVTDDDGRFTMPNAPQGKHRLVVWHEKVGLLGGKDGRFGTQIEIAGPVTQLKTMDFPGLK